MLTFRSIAAALVTAACLLFVAAPAAQAQTSRCVIATNDGQNGFRTDEITQCRINTSNGSASFVMNGDSRQRTYAGRQPLTSQHLEVATYWLNRSGQLRLPAATNPAGFDVQSFMREAAKATQGFVLVRNRNRGPALNLVFITDGVYRSIDLPSTNLRDVPSGLLVTQ